MKLSKNTVVRGSDSVYTTSGCYYSKAFYDFHGDDGFFLGV